MVSFSRVLTAAVFVAAPVLALSNPARRDFTVATKAPCEGYEVVSSTTDPLTGITTTHGTCATDVVAIEARGFSPATDNNKLLKRECGGWDYCYSYQACSEGRTNSCFSGSGGPDPNHCNVITNNAAASGGSFDINPGSVVTYTYSTCGISVTNQINWVGYGGRPIAVNFCYSKLASYGSWLAWNCQAAQGAAGGIAVAAADPAPSSGHNEPWYLMVFHT